LESKSSDLATPSHLDQSRPNLKVWTPTRLNLMAVRLKPLLQPVFSRSHAARGNENMATPKDVCIE